MCGEYGHVSGTYWWLHISLSTRRELLRKRRDGVLLWGQLQSPARRQRLRSVDGGDHPRIPPFPFPFPPFPFPPFPFPPFPFPLGVGGLGDGSGRGGGEGLGGAGFLWSNVRRSERVRAASQTRSSCVSSRHRTVLAAAAWALVVALAAACCCSRCQAGCH